MKLTQSQINAFGTRNLPIIRDFTRKWNNVIIRCLQADGWSLFFLGEKMICEVRGKSAALSEKLASRLARYEYKNA